MSQSNRRIVALGWQLEAFEIAPLAVTVDDDRGVEIVAEAIGTAGAVLLSCAAISRIWDRAVGESPRFRSAVHEEESWRRLVRLLSALRQLLDRGGALVCRLDLPSPACSVARPLEHPLFPQRERIDCYDALAVVHPLLAELAKQRVAIAEGGIELGDVGHAASRYLAEFHWSIAPAIGWQDAPSVGQALAHTPGGLPVAVVAEQLVLLPRLGRQDPAVEAITLLEMLDSLAIPAAPRPTVPTARKSSDRRSAIPKALGVPRFEALVRQEAELAERIAALETKRAALATRRELAERFWLDPAPSDEGQTLVERVERLMSVLGFLGPQGRPLWTIDSPGDSAGDPPGAQQHGEAADPPFTAGSISVDTDRPLPVVWFNLTAPHGGSTPDDEAMLLAARNLAAKVDGIVVPVTELGRAAAALLLAGGNEEVARAIRRSLANAQGVFRFSPGATLLTSAERKLLAA
ncbi:MAG: hypothetical protein AB7U73_11890 [Pirellulales bacterium]